MAAAGGSQCGYCTPGFVMSLFAEQYRPDRAGPVRSAGAWPAICAAAPATVRFATRRWRSGRRRRDRFRDRLEQPAPRARARQRSHGFSRPSTLDECVGAARGRSRRPRSSPAARISASNRTCAARRWPHLVSLEAIDELRECRETRDERPDRRGAAADRHRAAVARRARRRSRVARRSSPRRRFATARRSAATSRRPRRSATRRRCCWRSTPSVARSPGRPDGARVPLVVVLHRLPPDGARARRAARGDRDPEAAARSSCASTRSPSGGSTTSARWPRRWRSIATPTGRVRRARFAFGGVAATPVRVAEAEDAVVGQLVERSGGRARAARPRSHAARR